MGMVLCRFVWVAALVAASSLTAALPAIDEKALKVPMSDGVRLNAYLMKPQGAQKLPVILVRTPYGHTPDLQVSYRTFVDHGYAVVIQDVRGRYGSEGVFRPVYQESSDGNDTLNWIAKQPWSNGKIGMLGGSYVGIVQWKAALTQNPHLKAIFPVVSGSDEYRDRFYSQGGAMKLGHRLQWMADNLRVSSYSKVSFREYTQNIPLRSSDRKATGQRVEFFQEALNHPSFDAYWKSVSTLEQIERINTPVFSVGGWFDNYVEGDLDAFTALSRTTTKHRIVIGPWPHNMSIPFPGMDFGKDSSAPIRRYQIEWFDYWLKTPQPTQEFGRAPVHLFVMGANKWRDEQEWPLERTRYTPYYLMSNGQANSAQGDGQLAPDPRKNDTPDQFVYDPKHPVPTMGGAVCCDPKTFPWGPMEQSSVEARGDVLVYSTAALKQDVEVTGKVRVVLFAATSAPDTDFTAKLVDVYPDGKTRNLTDGILRLRYRMGLDRPQLAKPGEIYQLTIDAGVTSNVFKAGHKIRLEVSSSNFPRFDRNPNTGRTIADETELRQARQTVHHGQMFPSHVLLPIIP